MNREQAESLLAQLVFDDLEEPARSELLEYLKTDPELNERLGDMRLTAKLLHDAVAAEDAPKLDEHHKAELMKRIERDSRKRGVLRVIGRTRMHPAIAALVVISTAAILVGLLLPATGSARRAARQMKNTTQLRGILQGMQTHARSTQGESLERASELGQPQEQSDIRYSRITQPDPSDLELSQSKIDAARRKLAMKDDQASPAAADEAAGVGVVTKGLESSDRFAGRGDALYGDVPARQSDELYFVKNQVATNSGPTTEFFSLDDFGRRVEPQWLSDLGGADQRGRLYAQIPQSGEAAGGGYGAGGYGGYGAFEPAVGDRSGAIALNESSSDSTRGDSLEFYYDRQAVRAGDGVAAAGVVVLGDDDLGSSLTTATPAATPMPQQGPRQGGTSAPVPAIGAESRFLTPAEAEEVAKHSENFSVDKLLSSLDPQVPDGSDTAWYARVQGAKKIDQTPAPNTIQDSRASSSTEESQARYPADWPQITSGPVATDGNDKDKITLGIELKSANEVNSDTTLESPALGEADGKPAATEERSAVEGVTILGRRLVPADDPRPARKPRLMPVNPWVMTADDRLSTFAMDVDTASYDIARRYIHDGFLPPRHTVRMEEFVNNFDYNYPTGQGDSEVFTVHAEAGESPFGEGTVLLKVGVRGKVVGRDRAKPAHLVFVVDTSGSMDRDDRLPLVRQSLAMVLDQLSPRDRVTVVGYGTEARLLVESASAEDKMRILDALETLQTGGSTNLLGGIALGYEVAQRHFITGGVNRVILCSDGVANVGPSEADDLLNQAQSLRRQGVTFTSVGFGAGNYDDRALEQLANKGDGGYLFVGSLDEAKRVFVDNLAATRPTIAFDAKTQVDFDPARVRRYRLIGYENRDIADVDFRNDTVDAGEVGSGQSATALYEIELLGPVFAAGDQPDPGTVYIRYRDAETGRVREIESRLTNDQIARRDAESDPRYFLAAGAARFAEILRGSEHVSDHDVNRNLAQVQGVLESVVAQLPMDASAQELLDLVRRSRGLPRAE